MTQDSTFVKQIPTYCINLNHRKDRWIKCEHQFDSQGIKVIRFPAVENNKYPHLGVAQSHKKIIEIALKKDYEMICVLEDDIRMVKNFMEKVEQAICSTPENWHIIYL
jgi:GR25 family glycosyltransferase involved in LPS biosynthesis